MSGYNIPQIVKVLGSNGTATGYLPLSDVLGVVVGAIGWLNSDTQVPLQVQVVEIASLNVGVRSTAAGSGYGRTNVSAYTTADNAAITFSAQTVFGVQAPNDLIDTDGVSLQLEGDVEVEDDLTVDDNATITGNLTVGGNLIISTDMDGQGDVVVRGDLVEFSVIADRGDESGTPGNCTINKLSGLASVANGDATITVTNSLVTTSSIVFAVLQDDGDAVQIASVVPAAGSFTVTLTGTTTAARRIGFYVIN